MPDQNDRPDPLLATLIEGLSHHPPTRDLWPGISERLSPRRPGSLVVRWPVALAASLALLAAGSALTHLYISRGATTTPEVPLATTPVTTLPAEFASATHTLQAAIDELEQSVIENSATLDPTTRVRVEAAISALDAAISDARERADGEPADSRAARYLTRTMQRKLTVLQNVANLSRRS